MFDMNFCNLVEGSPFYFLEQGSKFKLSVGTIKSKTVPVQKLAIPTQQVFNVTVSFDGVDRTFIDIPVTAEVAKDETGIFSCNREKMIPIVEGAIFASKEALKQIDYHKNVIVEGEKMMEILNPKYAEEKRQREIIDTLKKKQDETDKVLTQVQTDNKEMLTMLRALMKDKSSQG